MTLTGRALRGRGAQPPVAPTEWSSDADVDAGVDAVVVLYCVLGRMASGLLNRPPERQTALVRYVAVQRCILASDLLRIYVYRSLGLNGTTRAMGRKHLFPLGLKAQGQPDNNCPH